MRPVACNTWARGSVNTTPRCTASCSGWPAATSTTCIPGVCCERNWAVTSKKALLRRSELAVPAANDHMFARAAASEADLVFLDLEDATAPAHKVGARGKAVTALNELDWGRTARAIRIN